MLKLVTETAVFSFYAGSDDGKNSEVCRYASILEKSELVAPASQRRSQRKLNELRKTRASGVCTLRFQ